MKGKLLTIAALAVVLCMMLTSISYAAQKESFGTKVRDFWRNLISYPARVTEETASVVADTGKQSVKVVTSEVKKVADVTSGDVAKTKDLVTEPITGTAQTAVNAVEETVKIPSEALKEKGPEEPKESSNQ